MNISASSLKLQARSLALLSLIVSPWCDGPWRPHLQLSPRLTATLRFWKQHVHKPAHDLLECGSAPAASRAWCSMASASALRGSSSSGETAWRSMKADDSRSTRAHLTSRSASGGRSDVAVTLGGLRAKSGLPILRPRTGSGLTPIHYRPCFLSYSSPSLISFGLSTPSTLTTPLSTTAAVSLDSPSGSPAPMPCPFSVGASQPLSERLR